MANLWLDPVANLESAARLAEAAACLSVLAGSDVGTSGLASVDGVRTALVDGLLREVAALTELAAALRRDARDVVDADAAAAGRLTAITRCLG